MLISIQYLRGIAAVMVVVFHTANTASGHTWLPDVLLSGAGGVDIFFVISGFIMWQSTARSKIAPADFLRKRLARIAPIYWLMTLVMCATPFISGTLARGLVPDIGHTLASLAFIPWQSSRDEPGIFFPVYTPGWTLNFEMFFYLVFAASLWIGEWRWRFLALITAFGVLVSIGCYAPDKSVTAWVLAPIILEFAGGICIGVWAGTQSALATPVAALMIVAGFIAMGATAETGFVKMFRVIHWGIPAILIVLGAVELERNRRISSWPLLLLSGDASYSLYVTHLFVIGVIAIGWHALHLWTSTAGVAAFFVVTLVASQITAIFVYKYIELPLSEAARKLLTRKNAASVAPAGP